MRAKKRGETAACSTRLDVTAWREELLSCAFEADLGISRLIEVVQIGPPKPSPPRKPRLPRRSR